MNGTPPKREFLTKWLSNRGLCTRRGAIVVLAALMMIVFLASVAFSVDVAYMQLTKIKLRSATDAAARAAGEGLSRAQDTDYARQAAKDVAAANLVGGEPLLLDDADVIFGNSSQQGSGAWAFTPNGQPINAVRVNGRRTREAPSGSVPIFFGRVFNVFDFQPIQAATVVRLDRDICIVVDRSSSMKLFLTDTAPTMSTGDSRFCQPPNMAQSRWGALSIGIDRFVDALDTTPQSEFVGLVSFGSAYTACSYSNTASDINCPLSANSAVVTSAMSTLSTKKFNGMTNIGAGITKGIEVLTGPSARPYAAKTMVLMSDGAYTAGTRPSLVAPQAAAQDIIIHTITYGEADPAEMKAISDATGGNNYIAPNAQALQDAFEEIALTLPVVFTD
ncbi:MAG: VWA domain-containing protein [Pirellulales bacterium]